MEGQEYSVVSIADSYNGGLVDVIVSKDHVKSIFDVAWFVTPQGYLLHRRRGLMHRYIWQNLCEREIPHGFTLDHVNQNKADNRIENLRLATHSCQRLNSKKIENVTSEFRGVSWSGDVWVVNGTFGGITHYIGCTDDEEEAAKMFDRWQVSCPDFKDGFRILNFPEKKDEYETQGPPLKKKKKANFTGVQPSGKRFYAYYAGRAVGTFSTEVEAAMARDDAVVLSAHLRSKKMQLNFPARHPEYINFQPQKMHATKVDGDDVYVNLEHCEQPLILNLADFERFKGFKQFWSNNYVLVVIDKKIHRLARCIMEVTATDQHVFYKNGNTLDCRRENLEIIKMKKQ